MSTKVLLSGSTCHEMKRKEKMEDKRRKKEILKEKNIYRRLLKDQGKLLENKKKSMNLV